MINSNKNTLKVNQDIYRCFLVFFSLRLLQNSLMIINILALGTIQNLLTKFLFENKIAIWITKISSSVKKVTNHLQFVS